MIEIEIYADGGSLDNQKPTRRGYFSFKVFYKNEMKREVKSEIFPGATCNQMEWKAFEEALNYAIGLQERSGQPVSVIVHMDSENVVKGFNGKYKIKNPILSEYCTRVGILSLKLAKLELSWIDNLRMKVVLGH